MAFSRLNQTFGSGSGISSLALFPMNDIGAGLVIVTIQSLGTAGLTFTINDPQGNAWIPRTTITQGTLLQKSWYCLGLVTAASHVITIGSSAPMPSCNAYAEAYSGNGTFQTSTSGSAAAASVHTGSLTPNAGGALCYVPACAVNCSLGISIDSGFSQLSNAAGAGLNFGFADLIQGSPAAVNPQYTFPSATAVIAEMLVFNSTSISLSSGSIAPSETLSLHGRFQTALASGSMSPADTLSIHGRYLAALASGSISPADTFRLLTALASGSIAPADTLSLTGGGYVLASGSISPGDAFSLEGGFPGLTDGNIAPGDTFALASSGTALTFASGSITPLDVFVASNIALACPIANTGALGVPYTGQIIAIGTGALTFTIYSGILPPGLSLNPSTGTIIGTPTTPGTFPYGVKVTDSTGISAKMTCAILVSGSQALSPCNSVVQNPTTDSYFELRKVCVWMKPNKRLPVRGAS